MRITSKGQVTIPQHVREALGLLPHTEVEFTIEGSSARITKIEKEGAETRGAKVLQALRSGRSFVSMSTEEIMALTRGEA